MTNTDKAELTIENNLTIAEADKAKEKIASFLKKNNVNNDTISSIELAAYEAIVNVIEHSDYDDSVPIKTTLSITHDIVTTTIIYNANEFDITKVKLPDIVSHYKSGKKSGLGIYFIRTLMDKVNYTFNDGVNVLVLEKKL